MSAWHCMYSSDRTNISVFRHYIQSVYWKICSVNVRSLTNLKVFFRVGRNGENFIYAWSVGFIINIFLMFSNLNFSITTEFHSRNSVKLLNWASSDVIPNRNFILLVCLLNGSQHDNTFAITCNMSKIHFSTNYWLLSLRLHFIIWSI